ncbi:hypothetical protein CMO93_04670 [Candidatus Woesearchaeota archaeon]|nr:hypothetical protein [Candidatus Woesearchaeota archaeon]
MGKIRIGFADLTHTGKGLSSLMFPFGIASVASYAKKELGDQIELELFKYPNDLKRYLEETPPKIMCFANFYWTYNLSIAFAEQIKRKYPETVIIFGGPNYPRFLSDQQKILTNTPIDFHIYREGELSFVEIFKILKEYDFEVDSIKSKKIKIPNCHYVYGNEIIRGETSPKMPDIEKIPSPYLTGLMDKFFDNVLTPALQTTRGCPFQCAYCQESSIYFTKLSRYSSTRIKKELEYIAKRTKVPELQMADSNFGMYDVDLEISRIIADIQKKYDYPKYINVGTGKNRKELVIKVSSILKGTLMLFAAVQSTDPTVLKNISRQNVKLDDQIEIGKAGEKFGANTLSEIILCLPGDTLKAHLKSMCDMADIGINVVRSHQLIMLPDTELYSKENRKKFGMVTGFRVYPRCFGKYELFGESFSSFEIEEFCIGTDTMPFEDYLECRKFDLTVEIFYNSGIFYELFQLLSQKSIKVSYLIKKLHDTVSSNSALSDLYDGFVKVGKDNTWENKEELEKFLKQPGVFEKYSSGKLGNNEQLNYRALTFFKKMDVLHEIMYGIAKQILSEKGCLNDEDIMYLDELCEFSLLLKGDILSLDLDTTKHFHFDFIKLISHKFDAQPLSFKLKNGIKIRAIHSQEQKDFITGYLKQYGTSIDGLGLVLSRCHINKIYREAVKVEEDALKQQNSACQTKKI